jgi:mannan endo-1,4-beta-mannosidase
MRKNFLLIAVLFISLFFNACSTFKPSGESGFIKVNGTHFEQNGKWYYFTGTNLWYGCYLGSLGNTGNRQRLLRELDNLKSLGITNLRVLGASEESYIKNSLKPAIQKKPGVYDQDLLDGLDFLLSEMGKRGMHAVIFLNNYWEWTGGMSQYNDWANGGGGVDPGTNNYGNFMDYSATFYGNEKAKQLFINYVYYLLTRKNNYTGKYYYEDPAIMAWELANEPRPGRDRKWLPEYYTWIESTAQFIHNIDHNHLVTTGNEGLAGSLEDSTIYLTAHKIKYIDYLTMHVWPKNWGWFDAKNIAGTYDRTEKNAINYIDRHIEFARELNKPITMEEFGLPRDGELCQVGTPTTARDRYFKKILGLLYDSAAAGAPIAGTNFWGWGGEGRGQHPDNKYQFGDPLLADPFQEPQGLNSVFNVDTSTINILKNSAEMMDSLNKKAVVNDEQQVSAK